jgi:hypothetical protein
MEAKDPVVFQANRSNLRLFGMTEVGFSLGMMLGPLLTGSLFETVGFFYMTVVLGESFDKFGLEFNLLISEKLSFASSRLLFHGVGWIPSRHPRKLNLLLRFSCIDGVLDILKLFAGLMPTLELLTRCAFGNIR